MSTLKFAIFGTGFWSQFQLGAWTEIKGVECVALYNRTKSKADNLAKRFNIPHTYDDPDELLKNEELSWKQNQKPIIRQHIKQKSARTVIQPTKWCGC